MPEGPELCFMSEFINTFAKKKVFTRISRSELANHVRKHPEILVPETWSAFTLSVEARGKELRLIIRKAKSSTSAASKKDKPLKAKPRRGKKAKVDKEEEGEKEEEEGDQAKDDVETITVLFRMGMSGHWTVKPKGEEFYKHAHLRFHVQGEEDRKEEEEKEEKGKKKKKTKAAKVKAVKEEGSGEEDLCLCFIDVRRFGSWQVTEDWGDEKERGPDIVTEHAHFKQVIKDSLDSSVFDKAICEVMLDQKYFNGVGNYLRAEILDRAGIHPFARARDVLTKALANKKDTFFQCCVDVWMEALKINREFGFEEGTERQAFEDWLQCYSKADFAQDAMGRRVWFFKSKVKDQACLPFSTRGKRKADED